MKRLIFVFVLALALPAAALAKGPSAASINGPGLGKALSFTGNGEQNGSPLGNLTLYAGFFPAAFGQSPDPMLPGRPSGRLGPKLTIHYIVPGPSGERFRLAQDVYPYAAGGALTYMKPGQRIFDAASIGGWFRGGYALKQLLVNAGLSRSAPRGSSGSSLALFAGIGAPGALLLVAAAVLMARRRHQSGDA